MKRKSQPYSETEVQKIIEMRPTHTWSAIAKELGRTPAAVMMKYKSLQGRTEDTPLANGNGNGNHDAPQEFCINPIALEFVESAIRNGYAIHIPEMGIVLKSTNGASK